MKQRRDGLRVPAKLDGIRGRDVRGGARVFGPGVDSSGAIKSGSALIAAIAALVVLAVSLCAAWYLNSAFFRERMRQKLVFALQSVTGGTVEIEHFQWHLSRLEFDVDNITIHGLEAAGEQPY